MKETSSIQVKFAKVLSVLFHPIFLPTILFAFLVYFSPNVFYGFPEDLKNWWLITISYITITFPLVTVFLLWRLKFIESMHMHGLKERYGPLIASMLFYFWVFWLFHKQFQAPLVVQTLLLGTFLTTVLVFMCSIFFKISMHTAAWASAISFASIACLLYVDKSLILLIATILIGGLVGSARLLTQAHTNRQVWLGYIMGAIAMPIAYFFVHLIS